MAVQSKQIYGQTFISGDSLVQDIILLVINGNKTSQSENTVTIIENIWDDLKSTSGTYKTNGKGYWYWESQMTDIGDTDKNVKVEISCPKPGPEVFDYDYTIKTSDSDWTKYWKGKMAEVEKNLYNSSNGLQQKEITLPGTKYINQNGETVTVDEINIERSGLGDIQNLLNSLY